MEKVIKNTNLLIFLLFAFIVLLNNNGTGQTVKVIAAGKQTEVATEKINGHIYFDIESFSKALKLPYSINLVTGKIEIKTGNSRIKFATDNPFAVLIKGDSSPKSYNTILESKRINGGFFIPLENSKAMLIDAFEGKFEFVFDGNTKTDDEQPGGRYAKKDADSVITEKEEVSTKPDEVKYLSSVTDIEVEDRANGQVLSFQIEGDIPKITHNFNKDSKEKVIRIRLDSCSIRETFINKKFDTGVITEIKGINGENGGVIELTPGERFASYDVSLNRSKKQIKVVIYENLNPNEDKNKKKDKWEFNVVVLDAGHGGKDHGAIGSAGVKEKDVNLNVTKMVGELIKKNIKNLKVVYSRDTDVFVELYKRGKLANEAGGNLFVSIHCNSTPERNSKATGYEVYLLRPGKSKDAAAIAEKENSVIELEDNPQLYKELNDENFILVSMAQAAYMRYSEKFAEILITNFGKFTSLPSRGIKQAGFQVLVGASMPNVLIELGFLSNSTEEKYLASKKGQEELALAIFESIKSFKEYYDLILTNEK